MDGRQDDDTPERFEGPAGPEPATEPTPPEPAEQESQSAEPARDPAAEAIDGTESTIAVEAWPWPPPPPAAPVPPPVRAQPPRVGETVSGAFDLALAASRPIRRASLYVGVLTLVLIGPATLLFLVIVRDQGSLEAAIDLFYVTTSAFQTPEQGAIILFQLSIVCAVVGIFVLSLEAQIIATAILGGVAVGRRIGIRDSLRLSRAVFWRVVGGAILVGILRSGTTAALTAILDPRSVAALEGAQVWALVAETIVAAPFAYFLAGIVIGGVGPIEGLKRSVRIARARWRLAFLVSAAGSVIAFIQAFALGAGLDVLVRISTAAGLGIDGDAQAAVLTSVVILAALVALGSLLVTITALIAAPQVFVFLRMTGYSAGLERAFAATDGRAGSASSPGHASDGPRSSSSARSPRSRASSI